jgi:hypothetical protein
MLSATILAFPQPPADRLRLALRQLDAALAEQASAVSGFRGSLGELREAVGLLGAGFDAYRAALDHAAAGTAVAYAAALRLQATAARMG